MSSKRFMMGPELRAKLDFEEQLLDARCPDRKRAFQPNDLSCNTAKAESVTAIASDQPNVAVNPGRELEVAGQCPPPRAREAA